MKLFYEIIIFYIVFLLFNLKYVNKFNVIFFCFNFIIIKKNWFWEESKIYKMKSLNNVL